MSRGVPELRFPEGLKWRKGTTTNFCKKNGEKEKKKPEGSPHWGFSSGVMTGEKEDLGGRTFEMQSPYTRAWWSFVFWGKGDYW